MHKMTNRILAAYWLETDFFKISIFRHAGIQNEKKSVKKKIESFSSRASTRPLPIGWILGWFVLWFYPCLPRDFPHLTSTSRLCRNRVRSTGIARHVVRRRTTRRFHNPMKALHVLNGR